MREIILVAERELMSFVAADRGMFVVHFLLIACWGMLFATQGGAESPMTPLWFAMFSVVVSAVVTNTVFVTERISGALEIILTSGISRQGILLGKMLFVLCLTQIIGAMCLGAAAVLRPFVAAAPGQPQVLITLSGCALYCCASFLLTASSAYFSVVLPNPRLLHFINLVIVGSAVAVPLIVADSFPAAMFLSPAAAVPAALALAGVVFALLAKREFNGERITRPIIL
ncbi:MAG: hypothetical protein MUF22_01950 [Chitinispirillaceae bacterium]|jgi:ABC-type Na+ efflux pump permease subunit|nr:hypothetical protein [Chitinispirillaceae bacterium]